MLRKLLSHATIYGLSAQVPRLVGVLTLPIITQYLTSRDYGVAGVVTAYVAALNIVHTLGLTVVMANAFAHQPSRFHWIWRQLHGFISLWSLVYGLMMIFIIYQVVPAEAREDRLAIALLSSIPIMFFASTELQANLFYQLSQRPLPLALRSFVSATVGVGLNVYTIAFLKMGYMGWFYSYFISLIVGFFFNSYSVYVKEKLRPIFNFKWYRIHKSLKTSLPLIPHHLAGFLLDASDRLILSVLSVPVRSIGLYNVASSFGTYFQIASYAISQAASPFYMRLFAQQKGIEAALSARTLTFSLQIMFLFTTSLLCLWMREIFGMLIRNEELQQAYPLAIVILMGYNYRPMFMAVSSYITYRENTKVLWKISVVAGGGNVLLNLILVPIYGFEAAAYTTFGALMYMGYAGFYLREFRETSLVNYYPLLWLIGTVALLVGLFYLVEISIFAKTIITVVVGAIAVVLGYRQRGLLLKD